MSSDGPPDLRSMEFIHGKAHGLARISVAKPLTRAVDSPAALHPCGWAEFSSHSRRGSRSLSQDHGPPTGCLCAPRMPSSCVSLARDAIIVPGLFALHIVGIRLHCGRK